MALPATLLSAGCYAQANLGWSTVLSPRDATGNPLLAVEGGLHYDYRNKVRVMAGAGGQYTGMTVQGEEYLVSLPLSAGVEVTALNLQPWFVRAVAKAYVGGAIDRDLDAQRFRVGKDASGAFLGIDFNHIDVQGVEDTRREAGYGLLVGTFLLRASPEERAPVWLLVPSVGISVHGDAQSMVCAIAPACGR
jgi:hypothetical protein